MNVGDSNYQVWCGDGLRINVCTVYNSICLWYKRTKYVRQSIYIMYYMYKIYIIYFYKCYNIKSCFFYDLGGSVCECAVCIIWTGAHLNTNNCIPSNLAVFDVLKRVSVVWDCVWKNINMLSQLELIFFYLCKPKLEL